MLLNFKEKLLNLWDSPAFLRWAALTSLSMVIGLFIIVWALSIQMRSLARIIDVHDQVLSKMAKGELPLLQKEDGEFVPLMQFILFNLKEQGNKIEQLNSVTPSTAPRKFQL